MDLSTARDLEAPELRALVKRLAGDPGTWRDHDLDATQPRAYRELVRHDHLSVWLISWGEEADTGFHDHDVSSGAVHVIRGAVEEERLLLGAPPSARRFAAGDAFDFDASVIHRVTHTGDAPALTLHAYSPPLWRMGAYLVEPSGVLTRRSISYAEELRPLEAAA